MNSNEVVSSKRSLASHLVDYVRKTRQSDSAAKNPPSKRGSLCLAYSIVPHDRADHSTLTLHVLRARRLSLIDADDISHPPLNTFVKVSFSPSGFEQSSSVISGSASPVYDQTFSIVCNNKSLSTPSKRLTIAVCNQSISNTKSDLIGCMSFNMKTLLKTSPSTKTSTKYKWYCLLPESIGRHKRMAMINAEKSSTHSQKTSKGILLNVTITDRTEMEFSTDYPCTIREVKSSHAAPSTRPMPGDLLLQVNEINVSRTQGKAVKKLLRNLPLPIHLQLYRRCSPSTSVPLDRVVLNSVDQHQPLNIDLFPRVRHSPQPIRRHVDMPSSLLMSPIHRPIVDQEQSDESESGVGSESNPYSDGDDEQHRLKTVSDSYEREARHLISLEREFIRQIELGVQLYSRPLKHYLISSNEHAKLFQNIEKILAISRYQLNRLQALSEETIIHHLGQIFHEKVQLICEAFTRYMSGYADACLQLKQLSKCASFQRFIQNGNAQLSIEQFLQIPLNHIDNLAQQLDILCCTCDNAHDANYLLHVLKELRQCSLQESSSSQGHCLTTMSLNSADASSHQIDDPEIVQLQARLQHSTKPLILTGRNRHVIFSGTLFFQTENKIFVETWAVLLNDMLLLTQANSVDSRLTLVCNPILLNDIVDFRSSDEREDALMFVSSKGSLPYKLRYPSKCLQYAWQTILDQRLKTWQRSMHDDSSSADSDLE